jgi:hypothetical protein
VIWLIWKLAIFRAELSIYYGTVQFSDQVPSYASRYLCTDFMDIGSECTVYNVYCRIVDIPPPPPGQQNRKTVRENVDNDIVTQHCFPRAHTEENRELLNFLIAARATSSQRSEEREISRRPGPGNSSNRTKRLPQPLHSYLCSLLIQCHCPPPPPQVELISSGGEVPRD